MKIKGIYKCSIYQIGAASIKGGAWGLKDKAEL